MYNKIIDKKCNTTYMFITDITQALNDELLLQQIHA
jgi:hypothetical protein